MCGALWFRLPMLLRHEVLGGIESGRIVAVYRSWSQPRVRTGSTFRTAVGVVEVTSVDPVEAGALTVSDAREAGFGSVADLLAEAGSRGDTLYRIGVRHLGPDPRVALRQGIPDAADMIEIDRRLARLDVAGSHGPWTEQTMRLIAANPGVRAEDLARMVGREKMPFKLDVRKLKELGLTESLRVGYQLSPRGKAVMDSRGRR